MEVVSKSIMKINPESLSSHRHRDEALSVVSKLKSICTCGFSHALEGLRACPTRNKMNGAAEKKTSRRTLEEH